MESTLYYYQILSVLSSFLGISLGSFLLFRGSSKNKANAYLGLIIWSYTLFFLPGLFDAFGLLEKFHHVIRMNGFAGTLLGPLSYLYCKSTTRTEPIRFKNIYFHFIPFLIAVIYFTPTFLLPVEEKLAMYHNTLTVGRPTRNNLEFFFKITFTSIYTVISIRLVLDYLRHLKNTDSSIDPSFHRWLLFLYCSSLIPIASGTLLRIAGPEYLSIPVAASSISSLLFIVYFTLTFCPKFFHDFPNQITPPEEAVEDKAKYQQSKLQESQKDTYENKLLDFMKSEKPFLNSELTIDRLSQQLDIPPYHLSQLINERLNCNFLDFVNRYRVKQAQAMLKDSEMDNFTIVSIAQEAGFNSKTAFYSAFKKVSGCTPSQFRKGSAPVKPQEA